MTLEIRPITLRAACEFVATHHRHNKPVRGHKFSLSIWDGENLIGVANVGRPVARALDTGRIFEVNRTCTLDGRPRLANGHVDGANSMLYGAAWRASRAMGYLGGVTYTQHDEDGRSLRAAGWRRARDLQPHGDWHGPDLFDRHDAFAGIARVRWEIGVVSGDSPDVHHPHRRHRQQPVADLQPAARNTS